MDEESIEEILLKRISDCLQSFPAYAQVRRIYSTMQEWTVDNGLLTPTLKVKRKIVHDKYIDQIEKMYEGH